MNNTHTSNVNKRALFSESQSYACAPACSVLSEDIYKLISRQ